MKLSDADLLKLVPYHIAEDRQFAAASEALRPYLGRLARAIPNLLIYNRLGKADPDGFLPPLRRLTEAAGGLAELSEEILEELAWQFHVDFREAAQTRTQLAAMVRESIAWHRIKGTPASIQAALSLFNFGGIYIDEFDPGMHWASYQLGFDEVASLDDLRVILKICQEMQPARCRLWRVYSKDYDYRPGVWSGPMPRNAWSECWWSSYSGTYFPGLPGLDDRGLLVSFALRRKFLCEPWAKGDFAAGIAYTSLLSERIPIFGYPVWSVAYWGEKYPQRLPFSFTQIIPLHGCEYIYEPEIPWYDAPWQEKPWAISHVWDRRRTPFSIFLTGIPFAQECWSDSIYKGARRGHPLKDTVWQKRPWRKGDWAKAKSGGWSGTNSFWGTREILVTAQAPVWGQFKWSDSQPEPVYKRIDEFFYDYWAGNSANLLPDLPKIRCCRSELQPMHINCWRNEAWPNLPWSGGYAFGAQVLAGQIEQFLTHPWSDSAWPDYSWREDFSGHAACAFCEGHAFHLEAPDLPEPQLCQTAFGAARLPSFAAWPDDSWPGCSWRDFHSPRLFSTQTAASRASRILDGGWPGIAWPDQAWNDERDYHAASAFSCSRAWQAETLAQKPPTAASAIATAFAANAPRKTEWHDGAWPAHAWNKTIAYQREQAPFCINMISEPLEA